MKADKMEYMIYQEFKKNVINGDYNGIQVTNVLNSSRYFEYMKCKNLDKNLFNSVSSKIQQELKKGFVDGALKAPLPVREKILNAKFGDRIFGVSINKKFLSNIDAKLKILENREIVMDF